MMVMTIAASEFLRPEHRNDEVDQETQRDKSDNKYIHKSVLLEASAPFRVSDAEQEKSYRDGDKNGVRGPRGHQASDNQDGYQASYNRSFFNLVFLICGLFKFRPRRAR